MKRILRTGILMTALSVFFTGCGSSSLVSGVSGGYKEIPEEVKETEQNIEEWEMPTSEVPDYNEENENQKQTKPEGIAAFKIADEHSDDTKDIETFEIGNLLPDGTFLYYYTTKEGDLPAGSKVDNRKVVHCAAAYNYTKDKDNFKAFHTNTFTRIDEDSESFYMQLCSSSGDGDIFIYDNGIGYLYEADGTLKFKTDIETFVRKHFKGYSIVATEALTDGNNRIYVDLAIEKDEISASPESDTGADDDMTEEEADKAAEELDKEFSDKLIETVLVYDFQEYTSSLDQTNLKLDDQIQYWQEMRNIEAGYESWTPPAEEDWENTLLAVPSEWGPAHLYELENWSKEQLETVGIYDQHFHGAPVFQWNGDPIFGYQDDGCVSDFTPDVSKYSLFTEVKEDTDLTNVFVKIDGHYYELYGKTGTDLHTDNYNPVSFERTVKRVDYFTETITDPETSETTEHVTSQDSYTTQTLKVNRKRDTYLTDGYLEGYWTLNDRSIVSVFDVIDGYVFAMEREGSGDSAVEKIGLLNRDGVLQEVAVVTGASFIDIYKQKNTYYISVLVNGSSKIYPVTIDGDQWNISGYQSVSTALLNEPIKKVFNLQTDVDAKYHDAYDDMVKDDSGNVLGEEAGEHLNGTNTIYVELSDIRTKMLENIKAYKDNEDAALTQQQKEEKDKAETRLGRDYANPTGRGYLICSSAHGLVYLDHGSRYAFSLDEGTWYGIWDQGDKIVAVGYSNDGTSYGAIDKAHACVKEFDIDFLYRVGLEGILTSMYKVLTSESEKELSDAQENLLKQWDEIKKDRNVTFITPEEGQDVYDAWKDTVPGELTQERLQPKETVENGEGGQETPKE